jgi:hypothetical protein
LETLRDRTGLGQPAGTMAVAEYERVLALLNSRAQLSNVAGGNAALYK